MGTWIPGDKDVGLCPCAGPDRAYDAAGFAVDLRHCRHTLVPDFPGIMEDTGKAPLMDLACRGLAVVAPVIKSLFEQDLCCFN